MGDRKRIGWLVDKRPAAFHTVQNREDVVEGQRSTNCETTAVHSALRHCSLSTKVLQRYFWQNFKMSFFNETSFCRRTIK
ncbi:hypothetical protein L5515_018654 [Caenorhabditis briggsae]|uniref:Uncharacterized protein n=1 Tax=Caenorhabditis briggsae TaxID=6238 RepID=A0AAE8ZWS2_CAEBR|nr:hypothetical protein L3Y34_012806 [Caenorhabditis briggsae]UMM43039.1 hypothetical protein L5515_018654 [Caenorhabditis briggsae]